jgi:hypothetical protein
MSAPAEESTSRSFFFRVAIGGDVIPGPALTYHQFNHRSQATLRSGGSLVVAPIRTGEPLSVMFVASDDIDVLPGLRPQDIFLRPDLRHFIQRQVVPANDQVILSTKNST